MELYLQDYGDDSENYSAKNRSSKIKDNLLKGQFLWNIKLANQFGFGF